MHSYSSRTVSVQKGDKLSKFEFPQNDKEIVEMERVSYASAVYSLMYAQVCTRPDVTYAVNDIGRY